jgi:hypothetical protein
VSATEKNIHSTARSTARGVLSKARQIDERALTRAVSKAVDAVLKLDRSLATSHHSHLKTVHDVAQFILNDVEAAAEDIEARELTRDIAELEAAEKPKITKKLATSDSLDELTKLIAEFYYSKPERITFTDHETHWKVQNGEKVVTPIVVQQGKRFVFGTGG